MSKFDAFNFLQAIKDLVTGGGREKDGTTPLLTAGFKRDMNFSLQDMSNDGALTTAATTTIIIPLGAMSTVADGNVYGVAIPFAFTATGTALFRCTVPITTGAKATTLTSRINTTNTTGGVISVAGTYAANATQAASAAYSANNVGTAGQVLNVIASSTTAFTEGAGQVEIQVINNTLLNTLQLAASETNLRVISSPPSTTQVGTVNTVIPRDYDETTDDFTLHLGLAMSGATDTPTVTATAYRKRPGSNIVTVATSVAGKLRSGTAATLSATEQVVVIDFGNNGLLMDDAITIVVTVTAHTTDSVLVYYVEPTYRSTLVAFHESTGGTRDGKNGTFIR